MNQFLLLVLFSTVSLCSYAQEQEGKAKFVIQDAQYNKVDVSEQVISQGSYLAFYTVAGDDDVYFSNFMSKANTQSYGRIFDFDGKTIQETETDYKYEYWTFRWSYQNTYDNKRGTAKVTLYKLFKPKGIAFKCTIIPENLDEMIYSGYMEGSIQE